MQKSDVAKFFKGVRTSMVKHSPEILTGVGIAGMIGTTIMAVKATPKALQLLEEAKIETKQEKLTPVDVVKTTWKCYIPAAVTGLASSACLLKAASINTRRNAALLTAYNLSKTALSEYKEKVIETIGETKEQAVVDKIAKHKIDNDPVSAHEVIVTDKGSTLCYDGIFGRYFYSDKDSILRAINKVNRELVTGGMYVSLNEFYDELGLPHTKIGDVLGWNVDDGEIDVDFSYGPADDGRPCLIVMYNVVPKRGYSSYA